MLNLARKRTEMDGDDEIAARPNLLLIKTGSTEPPADVSFSEVVMNMWTVTFIASHV